MAPPGHQLLEIQSTKHANGRAIALMRADAAGPTYFVTGKLPFKEA
jgi:hypothetical protein